MLPKNMMGKKVKQFFKLWEEYRWPDSFVWKVTHSCAPSENPEGTTDKSVSRQSVTVPRNYGIKSFRES